MRDGHLIGSGADSLAAEARANQFILVGEDHGIREVPEFVGALFELAKPAGYRHLAVEVGPFTGLMLEDMMRASEGQRNLDAFLARYTPYSVPFFFWREEAQMLERVVKSLPGQKDVVWGLDQEFMISPTYLFDVIAEYAPAGRLIAMDRARVSRRGDSVLIKNGDPSQLWMLTVTDTDIAKLRDVFRYPPANTIIDEIATSRDIYRKFAARAGYESNQQRDDLMKTHFVARYRGAQKNGESTPRAIIKLGANHVFRGPSITDTYEIGSFVPEFAQSEGGHAINVLLLVKRGTWNAYRPFGSKEADKTKPYDVLTSEEYKVFDLSSLLAAGSDSSWTLLDLRPARRMAANGQLKVNTLARRLLTSFDAVVVVPEGHASVYFR